MNAEALDTDSTASTLVFATLGLVRNPSLKTEHHISPKNHNGDISRLKRACHLHVAPKAGAFPIATINI